MINLDFADVKTIMLNTGIAHMGIGRLRGRQGRRGGQTGYPIPLLETSIDGQGVLLNITGGTDLGL